MESLPQDTICNILYRLPIRSLLACKCVCKKWLFLLQDPLLHANFYLPDSTQNFSPDLILFPWFDVEPPYFTHYFPHLLDFNDPNEDYGKEMIKARRLPNPKGLNFNFVGSCNGLICLFEPRGGYPIYVCNPILGEIVLLPKEPKRSYFTAIAAIAFDATTRQYKVVRMLKKRMGPPIPLEVDIYTVGGKNRSWRSVGSVDLPLRRSGYQTPLVNGALHWLVDSSVDDPKFSNLIAISLFDVKSEEFCVMTWPRLGCRPAYLTQWRECLSIMEAVGEDHELKIWILKDYKGACKGSWIKQFTIVIDRVATMITLPFFILSNGDVLLWKFYNKLTFYNLDSKRYREVEVLDFPLNPMMINSCHIMVHTWSFISVKAAEEESREIVREERRSRKKERELFDNEDDWVNPLAIWAAERS